MTIHNQDHTIKEFQFVDRGDTEDWAAHIKILNQWTPEDNTLRHIIQYARSGEFHPADMHVDLIEQYIESKLAALIDRIENGLLDDSIALENEETAVKWYVVTELLDSIKSELLGNNKQ